MIEDTRQGHLIGVRRAGVETEMAVLERGRDAIRREAWGDAYEAFSATDRTSMTPADLEGFADAAWWQSRMDEAREVRQKAYAGYADAGDDPAAAFVALRLCIEHFLHDRGVVTTEPGLFFVGLPFQYAATSDVLPGVGRDAGYIAKQIAARRLEQPVALSAYGAVGPGGEG